MSRSSNGTSSPSQGIEIFFFLSRPTRRSSRLLQLPRAQTRPSSPQPRARAQRRPHVVSTASGWTVSRSRRRADTKKKANADSPRGSRSGVSLRWRRGGALSAAVQQRACTPQHGLETRRPGHDSAGGSRADRLSRGSIWRENTRCGRCCLVGSPTRRDGRRTQAPEG